MTTFEGQGKKPEVDAYGFLVRPDEWNEEFANATAPEVGITGGLTEAHWQIIRFVRKAFDKHGSVPLVFVTCLNHKLRLRDFKVLFPTGYHRGACRLAGVGYHTQSYNFWVDKNTLAQPLIDPKKVYRVNARGFIVDPGDWDEYFAVNKAAELNMQGGLTDEHWRLIRFLRVRFAKTKKLPSVIETCEENGIEFEDLQRLFPNGYHRGAVKLAGLRFQSGED
jgi:tRNA 2-thiouridine synthesizing protein E